MLILTVQAEDCVLQNGASIISDAECSSTPTNNAVLIAGGPENLDYNFGTIPVGATKIRIFGKKQTPGITDATININFIGGTPQYGASGFNYTAEGLHFFEFTTLPENGNNLMNIDGSKIIIDRIEWHNDTFVGTITIVDQTLPPVTAGTNGVAVIFTTPTLSNCTDSDVRILIDSGIGIVVKNNGVVMAISDTFLASDPITYDIPSNVVTTTAYDILRYRAVGVCGNSNLGILTANVTAAASTITIQNQNLSGTSAGTMGNSVTLTPPTLVNCVDTHNRLLISINSGITVKKAGVVISAGDTFSSADVLTYDVASNVVSYELFQYKAIGVCGDSNVAIIRASIASAASTIVVIDQTLTGVMASTTANGIGLTAPNTTNCVDTLNRIITGIGVGITLKKGGVTLAVNDTFTSSDVLSYDIGNEPTSTAYEIFQYKAIGACGDSNVSYITANVTAATLGSISISNQVLAAVISGTTGILLVFAEPVVVSGEVFSGIRKLTEVGAGITVKKNGIAMIIHDTWGASDIITCDIASTLATATAMSLLKYTAAGSFGESNEASIIVNINSPVFSGGSYYAAPTIQLTANSETPVKTNRNRSWIWITGGLFIGGILTIIFFWKRGK